MNVVMTVIGSIILGFYKLVFSWWLDPWLHHREHEAFSKAIKQSMEPPVLGQIVEERYPKIYAFDYVTVSMESQNLLISFTRGRGELMLTVGPKANPVESYKFLQIIAALDGVSEWQGQPLSDLDQANVLLRSRWQQLNDLFSPKGETMREALGLQSLSVSVPTSQRDWEQTKLSWK